MSATASILQLVVDVAVPVPGTDVFTYQVPGNLEQAVKAGVRVRIPFRNREAVGYAVQVEKRETDRELKAVFGVLDAEPVIQPALLKLTRQISGYYGSGWGEAIENALPKWVKFGKNAERALKAGETAAPAYETPGTEFRLTAEQQVAMDAIEKSMQAAQPRPILLHGVTGSGKSEIYIRAIRNTLSRNKAAICLVPEITLTEQIKLFFARHFGGELEILHSKLSDGERFLAWKRLETGKTRVVLGPRSALFAPVRDLGLIIMDEEHENTYKQETAPRYHARQVAVWRAANENALFIMGSATPSLEAMYAAEAGIFQKIVLKNRVDDRPLPEVNIVDLKDQLAEKKRSSVMFSRVLQKEIEDRLARKEGIMLLLNRRGFSTLIQCPSCGNSESCPSCQVSLTFHQDEQILLCHYCNYRQKVPVECSNCGSRLLRFAGFGTEKVESEAARWFPQARIGRLDADSIRQKGSHEKILGAFREKKIDILIGTQMIAKGFDFPHVTLVGVILADVGLMLPDFRSAERTFQLMTQVAGRAGRGNRPGKVIIQTFSPHHPSIVCAQKHDFGSFYKAEIEGRMKLRYPPFRQLINIIIRSKSENKAYASAAELGKLLQQTFGDTGDRPELIGPAPLPFYRLRGHFRWHIMMKCTPNPAFIEKIHDTLRTFKKPSVVQTAVDVDPVNIL